MASWCKLSSVEDVSVTRGKAKLQVLQEKKAKKIDKGSCRN